MAVASAVFLYQKMKHRKCRVRVIICRKKEIVQAVVMILSADVDEDMIPASSVEVL